MSDSGKFGSTISIVCVFNDPQVRENCLDRSINEYAGSVQVEYIPVDNTKHTFETAGAALNHGARQATHDVVVFVHQDVYLHSVDQIGHAASFLRDDTWGLLGASGIGIGGGHVGRMRDRVQLIGSNAETPIEVESLDEVLFLVARHRVLQYPITEDVDLAWHAYAVEYGLRMRGLGLGVGAVNLAITHNSLTTNLDRLDVAHRRIAALYPGELPVLTTCGAIGPHDPVWRRSALVQRHGWRLRWLQNSSHALQARSRLAMPVVLNDIREGIDLLRYPGEDPLHLVNLDRLGGFAQYSKTPVTVSRMGRPVSCWAASSMDELTDHIARLPRSASVLVADLDMEDLRGFSGFDERGWIAGLQYGATWLLGGPASRCLPAEWSARKALPLGASRRLKKLIRPIRPSGSDLSADLPARL